MNLIRYGTILYDSDTVIYLFSIRKLQINVYISSMANITEVNKLIEEVK